MFLPFSRPYTYAENHFKVCCRFFFRWLIFFSFFVCFCTRQVKALLIFMLTEVITVFKLAFCSSFTLAIFFPFNCLVLMSGAKKKDINKRAHNDMRAGLVRTHAA